jgi:hypothetical protein
VTAALLASCTGDDGDAASTTTTVERTTSTSTAPTTTTTLPALEAAPAQVSAGFDAPVLLVDRLRDEQVDRCAAEASEISRPHPSEIPEPVRAGAESTSDGSHAVVVLASTDATTIWRCLLLRRNGEWVPQVVDPIGRFTDDSDYDAKFRYGQLYIVRRDPDEPEFPFGVLMYQPDRNTEWVVQSRGGHWLAYRVRELAVPLLVTDLPPDNTGAFTTKIVTIAHDGTRSEQVQISGGVAG